MTTRKWSLPGTLGARVPNALNPESGHVKCATAFVWQVLFEAKNYVNRSEAIRQEGFGVFAEQSGVQRSDVRTQAPDALFTAEAVLVEVAVREFVAVAVVEA
jgi:hypothetical protein